MPKFFVRASPLYLIMPWGKKSLLSAACISPDIQIIIILLLYLTSHLIFNNSSFKIFRDPLFII